MSDREILKKLFKIAANQQKIINKLAQVQEPITDQEKDSFEEIFAPATKAWLTKNLTQNGVLEGNNIGRVYAAISPKAGEARSAVLTPTVTLLNPDQNKDFEAKLRDPVNGISAALKAALNNSSVKPSMQITIQDVRIYAK